MTSNRTWDDETLMRRVDGELPPEAGAVIDAAAASDPALAQRLEALRRVRTLARDSAPLVADPRDAALARLIAASGPARAPSLAERLAGALRGAFAPRPAALLAGLAAACFVAGLSLGWLGGGDAKGFVVESDGAIADAGLIRVLDSRLAAEGADVDGRAVGLTFRDADDRWCRTFRSSQAGVAGLACREGDGWTMKALAPDSGGGGELRTAAADIPAPVLAAVDAAIAGDTLDAAAELRARNAGWR